MIRVRQMYRTNHKIYVRSNVNCPGQNYISRKTPMATVDSVFRWQWDGIVFWLPIEGMVYLIVV